VSLARAVSVAAALAASSSCSPSPRDVVPETHDVRVVADAGATDTYAFVARRPHGVVALAEARHITDEDAHQIVERIADELERCATNLVAQGLLVEGAARIVAVAGPGGTPALNVRLAPGDAVAQNALLCLVAPVRMVTFPASKTGTPGLAIEATWGPNKSTRGGVVTSDGGAQ
jgi:hypothetical protein